MNKMSNVFLFALYGLIGFSIGFVCDYTADHCFTSIDIKYAYTMAIPYDRVYAKDRQLFSLRENIPVQIDNIVSADGWNLSRELITANKTMPGPPIYMYQNQTITIIVHNRLLDEAVSIHWHGIDQLEHPAMDGVAYVTQCPIMPNTSFNYTFKPRFTGSYWYHSHLGIQRDMGLYGAFIVLRERVPFQQLSMKQHIIQIQEWNHDYGAIQSLATNPSPQPHSILINGRGQFDDILAPIETFIVRKGDRYVFRLIGVGSHSTLLFSIPGLKLNITETDGFQIVPIVVDKIIIFPAERYDFEIDFDYAEERIYNITVSVLLSPNLTIGNDIGLGFLNVTKGIAGPLKVYTTDNNKLRVLNCPFENFPEKQDFTCIPVSYLNCTECSNNDAFSAEFIQQTNTTSLHFLNFGFPGGRSSINGRIYNSPTVAPLTQPNERNMKCDECGDEKTCECSYSLSLTNGYEVIMVLMTLGQGASISHPVHMHGHTFEILKMVFPIVTNDGTFVFSEDIKCSKTLNNSQSQCNNARWRNESWNDYKNIPGINLNNPIRKDTVVVPYGGYIIIRIYARNPGVWFLHCHIDKHMVEGMAVMLNESFDDQHRYIPNGLPTCNSVHSNSGIVKNIEDLYPDADCSLPEDLQYAVWEYNYTDLSDNSEKSRTVKIRRRTLENDGIFYFFGIPIYAWTCINSLTISNTETVVVFRSDLSETRGPTDENHMRWLYLCMKLTKVTKDLYYFYLLSDIRTDIFPIDRVFVSEEGNPPANNASICSTFCQYKDSDKLNIRTLKRRGTSGDLPNSTPLCKCASSCITETSPEGGSLLKTLLYVAGGCIGGGVCLVGIKKTISKHRTGKKKHCTTGADQNNHGFVNESPIKMENITLDEDEKHKKNYRRLTGLPGEYVGGTEYIYDNSSEYATSIDQKDKRLEEGIKAESENRGDKKNKTAERNDRKRNIKKKDNKPEAYLNNLTLYSSSPVKTEEITLHVDDEHKSNYRQFTLPPGQHLQISDCKYDKTGENATFIDQTEKN